MLTHNDIHFLVGVLSHTFGPENVSVKLGTMVWDISAKERRDVDITMIATDSTGNRTAFMGTEVKDERRPLDVVKVEGLCTKLLDMPEISKRAIVSSSGFTEGAVNKATEKGIELFRLLKQGDEELDFDAFVLSPNLIFNAIEVVRNWKDERMELFCTDLSEPPSFANYKTEMLFDIAGGPHPEFATLGLLEYHLYKDIEKKESKYKLAPSTDIIPVAYEYALRLQVPPFFKVKDKLICIERVRIIGELTITQAEAQFTDVRFLLRYGERIPFAGCLVFITRSGDMWGATISEKERRLRIFVISVADRNKKVIRDLDLQELNVRGSAAVTQKGPETKTGISVNVPASVFAQENR